MATGLIFILHEAAATADWLAARELAWITGAVLFFVPMCCLMIPTGIALACSKAHRRMGLGILSVGLGTLLGLLSTHAVANSIRHRGFERLTVRSRPLIDAIRKFESIYSSPPTGLTNLVPDFIGAIPRTGMSLYPDFRYRSFPTNKPAYGSNRWVLEVYCSRAGFNFDTFLYFPNGQYPAKGFGGRLERIHDWTYVHE